MCSAPLTQLFPAEPLAQPQPVSSPDQSCAFSLSSATEQDRDETFSLLQGNSVLITGDATCQLATPGSGDKAGNTLVQLSSCGMCLFLHMHLVALPQKAPHGELVVNKYVKMQIMKSCRCFLD